jgi:hypothetical protein
MVAPTTAPILRIKFLDSQFLFPVCSYYVLIWIKVAMPTLKPRYETFCQEYAIHANASVAADIAGYEDGEKQGWRLLRRPEIVARIAELRAEQAALDGLSLHAQLSKLEAAFHVARDAGDAIAMARIVEIGARLPGLFAKSGLGELTPAGGESTRAALTRIARQLGVAEPQDGAPKRAA